MCNTRREYNVQPKRRWSKARTGMKRSTWKIDKPTIATCVNTVMNQFYHIEYVLTVDIMMGKKIIAKVKKNNKINGDI